MLTEQQYNEIEENMKNWILQHKELLWNDENENKIM